MSEAVYNIEFAQTLKKMSHMAPVCKAIQPQRNLHEETEQSPTSEDMEEPEIPELIHNTLDHPIVLKPHFEEQKVKQPVGENTPDRSVRAEDQTKNDNMGFANRANIAEESIKKEKALSSFIEPKSITTSPKEFINIRNSVLVKHNLSEKNEEIRRLKNSDNKKSGEENLQKDIVNEELIQTGVNMLAENIKIKQLSKQKQEKEDVHRIIDEMKKVIVLIICSIDNWHFSRRK
jgi:hypothetical protein